MGSLTDLLKKQAEKRIVHTQRWGTVRGEKKGKSGKKGHGRVKIGAVLNRRDHNLKISIWRQKSELLREGGSSIQKTPNTTGFWYPFWRRKIGEESEGVRRFTEEVRARIGGVRRGGTGMARLVK